MTQVTTKATTLKTEMLKISTVTAWIDVLSFADSRNGTQAGSSFRAGASLGAGIREGARVKAKANEAIAITVTRTELATLTAVVKEVPVTALVYVLSYPSPEPSPDPTDAANTTVGPYSAPALLGAGNGTNVSGTQTDGGATSQDLDEILQAFNDGYALGKAMENPCDLGHAPAVGAVGKREDVWKDLENGALDVLGIGPDDTKRKRENSAGAGAVNRREDVWKDLKNGVLDVLGVGPDDAGSKHKERRQDREGLEKRRGGGHSGGSSGGSRGGSSGGSRDGGSADTILDSANSSTSSATHTTALPNLWITALIIGLLAFGAGASTAGFSDYSSPAISTSLGPKASDPTSLPSISSTIITNISRSSTISQLGSLTRLEKREGGGGVSAGAAAVAVANIGSGSTVRPNTPSVQIILVVALLFVLFTTRVTAVTTDGIGSVVVDDLAVIQYPSATIPGTLKSREVGPISAKADTATPSLGGGSGDSDEEKKKHHNGGVGSGSSSSGASPRSTAPTQWLFGVIMLVVSFTVMGATAASVHPGINSTTITEPVHSVDQSTPRFASPRQAPRDDAKRITNKSSTPFIAGRQNLSDGVHDIAPGNVNSLGYHIESHQVCSAGYNDDGATSSGARLPIKLALLALYFLFRWGFFSAAGSAITTIRETTDTLDLEDTSPTYPPSDTCTTTTSLPASVSGTGSPATEMDARHMENEIRSSVAVDTQDMQLEQDLIKGEKGRSTKPMPKPKDNPTRRARSCSAPHARKHARSSWTILPLALIFLVSISGCTASATSSTLETSPTTSLTTHSLPSTADTGLPSSTASIHGEEQGKSQQDDESKRFRFRSGGCTTCSSSSKARSTSLIWPSLTLLLMLLSYILGAKASTNTSALEPLSTNSTQPCEDGLDPSPILSPPNATNATNDQQAGTLQAAQAAEGFPVTSDTALARRGATGATLLKDSKAARSRIPSPLLLLGILALLFAAQTSALTLGSSAMARRALPDLHARLHEDDHCDDLPDPKARHACHGHYNPDEYNSGRGGPGTVVSRSDSGEERCDQLTGAERDSCMNGVFELHTRSHRRSFLQLDVRSAIEPVPLIHVRKLEISETVESRSNSEIDDYARTTDAEENEDCYETIDDGATDVNDKASHRNLAVRSAANLIIIPRKLETSETIASRADPQTTQYCNDKFSDPESRANCLKSVHIPGGQDSVASGSDSGEEYSPAEERCNQLTGAERESCTTSIVGGVIPPRNLDGPETITSRWDARHDECAKMTDVEEKNGCFAGLDNGVEGGPIGASRRHLAVRSVTDPIILPRKLKRSETIVSRVDSQTQHCNDKYHDHPDEIAHCLKHNNPADGPRSGGSGNVVSRSDSGGEYVPGEERCAQLTGAEYDSCMDGVADGMDPGLSYGVVNGDPTIRPRNLDGPEIITSRTDTISPLYEYCAKMTNEADKESCLDSTLTGGGSGASTGYDASDLTTHIHPRILDGPEMLTSRSDGAYLSYEELEERENQQKILVYGGIGGVIMLAIMGGCVWGLCKRKRKNKGKA